MRKLAIGILLAAVAGAAHGQATTWEAIESGETKGISLQAADGSQFILKCDKPGRNEVYAMILTDQHLVEPFNTFVTRAVTVRMDDKAPYDDNWRFYEHYVVAINKDRQRGTLTRLLSGLSDAQVVELRLYPEPRKRTPVTLKFDVPGAKEAIAHVYEQCNDRNPAA